MPHPIQADDLVKRLRLDPENRQIADLIEQQARRIAELESWNKYLAGQNEQLATKVDELEAELLSTKTEMRDLLGMPTRAREALSTLATGSAVQQELIGVLDLRHLLGCNDP